MLAALDATRSIEERWRAKCHASAHKPVEFTTPTRSNVLQQSVLACGGQLVGEHVFWDAYWDASRCGLTEKDWWLRNRAGRWELKASTGLSRCFGNDNSAVLQTMMRRIRIPRVGTLVLIYHRAAPVNSGHVFCEKPADGRCLLAIKVPAAEGGNGVTAYREITLASQIAEELKAAGFLGSGVKESAVVSTDEVNERMLEGAGFRMFASFRTNRTKYRYADTFYDGIFRIERRFSTRPTTLRLIANANILYSASLWTGNPGDGVP